MDALKVFISGTMDDLREEHQIAAEAIEAIGGLEWKSVMTESHGSQPFSLQGTCQRMVEECVIVCQQRFHSVSRLLLAWTIFRIRSWADIVPI
jgi:hypothetical protein